MRRLALTIAILCLSGCQRAEPSVLCKNHQTLASDWSGENSKSEARRRIKANVEIAVTHYSYERLGGGRADLPTTYCPECDRLIDRELEQARRDGGL
jgi:hypothetical protein